MAADEAKVLRPLDVQGLSVSADVKLTRLGEDGSHFGAADVDLGASNRDPSHGPKGRERQSNREAVGLLA